MKVRRVLVALVAVVTVAFGTSQPAQAGPGTIYMTGTFTTSGMWLPVGLCVFGVPPPVGTFCPSVGSWSLSSDTAVGVHNANVGLFPPGYVTGSGGYAGWCTNATGSGTMNVGGEIDTVNWVMVGGSMTMTGSGTHTAFLGKFQLRPITGNCATQGATAFFITGSISLL